MNDPIVSIRVWSYYVLGIGLALLVAPNLVFDVLGIANTSEVWVRVVGLVAIALGIVYFEAGRHGVIAVVRSSVPARIAAVAAFFLLWATGGDWQLLLFAAVDLVGVSWSIRALRAQRTATA